MQSNLKLAQSAPHAISTGQATCSGLKLNSTYRYISFTVCILLLVCTAELHTCTIHLEGEEGTYQPHDPLVNDSIIYREAASGGKVVHLMDQDSLVFNLYSIATCNFRVSKVNYSNDGHHDLIQIFLNGELVQSFSSMEQSDNGNLWNVFHSAHPTGSSITLSGNITGMLYANNTDNHGINIDFINVELTNCSVIPETNGTAKDQSSCSTDRSNDSTGTVIINFSNISAIIEAATSSTISSIQSASTQSTTTSQPTTFEPTATTEAVSSIELTLYIIIGICTAICGVCGGIFTILACIFGQGCPYNTYRNRNRARTAARSTGASIHYLNSSTRGLNREGSTVSSLSFPGTRGNYKARITT